MFQAASVYMAFSYFQVSQITVSGAGFTGVMLGEWACYSSAQPMWRHAVVTVVNGITEQFDGRALEETCFFIPLWFVLFLSAVRHASRGAEREESFNNNGNTTLLSWWQWSIEPSLFYSDTVLSLIPVCDSLKCIISLLFRVWVFIPSNLCSCRKNNLYYTSIIGPKLDQCHLLKIFKYKIEPLRRIEQVETSIQ